MLFSLFLDKRSTGIPILMSLRTSASLVNNFAPKCSANPSMAESITPRTTPNCRLSSEKSFEKIIMSEAFWSF